MSSRPVISYITRSVTLSSLLQLNYCPSSPFKAPRPRQAWASFHSALTVALSHQKSPPPQGHTLPAVVPSWNDLIASDTSFEPLPIINKVQTESVVSESEPYTASRTTRRWDTDLMRKTVPLSSKNTIKSHQRWPERLFVFCSPSSQPNTEENRDTCQEKRALTFWSVLKEIAQAGKTGVGGITFQMNRNGCTHSSS